MTNWLIELLVGSISVFVVTQILPAVHIRDVTLAVVVALVYGILKLFFRWILVVLTLPFMILTLGLFWFVINAFLLSITDRLVGGFAIDDFFNTLIASVLISLIDTVLHYWIRRSKEL
jgi:putative membrane protein